MAEDCEEEEEEGYEFSRPAASSAQSSAMTKMEPDSEPVASEPVVPRSRTRRNKGNRKVELVASFEPVVPQSRTRMRIYLDGNQMPEI